MTVTSTIRKRQDASRYVDTLLNSLGIDHLRLVIASLYGEGSAPSVRTRAAAIQAIMDRGAEEKVIIDSALEVEAAVVTKHCVLARLNGARSDWTILQKCEVGKKFQVDFGEIRVAGVRVNKKGVSITFEHKVVSLEWRQIDDVTKKLERSILRHPCIADFDFDRSIVIIRFPGYSQGSGSSGSSRLSYEALISGLLDAVRHEFGVSASALAVEDAISALQTSDSKRVRVIGSALMARHGRMLLSSDAEEKSVDDVLVSFLGPHVKPTAKAELAEGISAALRGAPASSYVAFWTREGVVTRIKFLEKGSEFLFIWGGVASSLAIVQRILRLVASIAVQLVSQSKDAWKEVVGLERGEVVTVREFCRMVRLEQSDARKVLLQAMNAGIVVPVYRLKTNETLVERWNSWQDDYASIARKFETESGTVVDGRDQESVEVAFRRVGGRGES